MPVDFLTPTERERLQGYPAQLSDQDLITFYTLTGADLACVRQCRSKANRLGFALQLGTLRWLGFVPDELLPGPPAATGYLAQQLAIKGEVIHGYGTRDQTRTVHRQQVQAHLGFVEVGPAEFETLTGWLVERALEHDEPRLLLSMVIDKLYRERLVRPTAVRLERLVAHARQQAGEITFQRLAPLLTPERQAFFDRLLVVDEDLGRSRLEWLRHGETANTPSAVLKALNKLAYLREMGIAGWDLSVLNPNRRQFLAQRGRRATGQALQRAPEVRRYPILAAFLAQAVEELTDEAVELFDGYLSQANRRADRELRDRWLGAARSTSQKLRCFDELVRFLLDDEIADDQLRDSIFAWRPREELAQDAVECRQLARPDDDHRCDLLVRRYSILRQFAPEFLAAFRFDGNRSARALLKAIDLLRELNLSGRRKVLEDTPLAFVPPGWLPYVVDDEGRIDRHFFEVCVLWELRGALRGGNVWVQGSRRYANPTSYLIPESQWPALRAEVCRLIQAPEDGALRLAQRRDELAAGLDALDQRLDVVDRVRINDGELIVGQLQAEDLPPSVKLLGDQITARLPRIDLPDLLIEVDGWNGFSDAFEHAGGGEPRSPGLLTHLYIVLVAHACNFGLETMADLVGVPYARLAWCQSWYLREETLQAAVDKLVNYQWSQPLSRFWGDGRLSSSDGQRFAVAVPNRLATALPRYFGHGRGLTFYTWTSDQYSQYGTRVIPATIRDATYVLDAILDNETELPIEEHTTDTAGYTELVFALFDLLGLQFAPRIRDLGKQQLYRCDSERTYRHIEPLLTGKIDQELILRHWDDLLRLAGSLKLGWAPASLLIGKLQAYPRQNALTQALQEYGRLIKTLYIARYLESERYRRRINGQLGKGEQLHALRRRLFYGHEGELQQRQIDDQATQAGCLNLVTNAVICWNTVYMNAAIEQLRAEGICVSDEDLAHLSPARSRHLNPYGRYRFDLSRKPDGLRPLRQPRGR